MAQAEVFDLIVVGGGAAGFFGAIRALEQAPNLRVLILEAGPELLSKVKISGGGRCNVTHHLFDPHRFAERYPRGHKEILGVLHRFQARDTVRWFEERGLKLKTESDGRMFPETNDSSSVIFLFLNLCKKYGIEIRTKTTVLELAKTSDYFSVKTSAGDLSSRAVLWASGGSRSSWKILEGLGHQIVSPVPSLFTFKLDPNPFEGLEGAVLPDAHLKIVFPSSAGIDSQGPVLITHWGVSGPAVLRLSAWGARAFAECDYKIAVHLQAKVGRSREAWLESFQQRRKVTPKKQLTNDHPPEISARLWQRYVLMAQIPTERSWSELKKEEAQALAACLTDLDLKMVGRAIYKDEFVTAGGVDLKEIHFQSLQSKILPGLYFAGEVLNIDGITGGFNFQNAWSSSWVAGTAIAEALGESISAKSAHF